MNWIPANFDTVFKNKTGGQKKVFKKDYNETGQVPIVDQGQEVIAGYTDDKSYFFKGELPVILFGDHTRIIKFIDFPFALGADGVKVLKTRKHIEPKYIFYYLNYKKIPSRGYSRHFKLLREISFLLPTPSEQKRIVKILDQADALRKKHIEADKIAERIIPALFYKMFGDPALNQMKWNKTTLEEADGKVRYGLGQPPRLVENGISMIRATNISKGKISEKNMIYVDPKDVPRSRNAFLNADEVLVVRSGAYTGDVAQVTKKWEGSVAGYDLVITPSENFCGEFIESYLLTGFIQKYYFKNIKMRGGQPHLNAQQLLNTPFLVPPKTLQEKYAHIIKGLREETIRRINSRETLETLFSVVLNNAFSGELTAKWREAHMKELLREMKIQTQYLNEAKI